MRLFPVAVVAGSLALSPVAAAQDIQPVQAQEVQPVQAAPVEPVAPAQEIVPVTAQPVIPVVASDVHPYVAATVKRMPARVNLDAAVLKAWSQPIRCSYWCRVTTAATMRSISASLIGMNLFQAKRKPKDVRVGGAEVVLQPNVDGLAPVKLSARARKALLKNAKKPVKVTVTTTVVDQNAVGETFTQTVTLTPPKKRRG